MRKLRSALTPTFTSLPETFASAASRLQVVPFTAPALGFALSCRFQGACALGCSDLGCRHCFSATAHGCLTSSEDMPRVCAAESSWRQARLKIADLLAFKALVRADLRLPATTRPPPGDGAPGMLPRA